MDELLAVVITIIVFLAVLLVLFVVWLLYAWRWRDADDEEHFDSRRERGLQGLTCGVVVIAKNEEEHLGKTLESLKQQTLKPFIVVVNDGSTDRTREIASKHAHVVIDLASKAGVFVGRPELAKVSNAGFEVLEKMQHDFVMVSGADSVYPANYLEKIASRMKRRNVVVASGSVVKEFTKAPRGSGRIIDAGWFRSVGFRYPENYGFEGWLAFKALCQAREVAVYPDINFELLRPTSHSQDKTRSLGCAMKAWGYWKPYAYGLILKEVARSPRRGYAMLKGYRAKIEVYSDLKSVANIQKARLRGRIKSPFVRNVDRAKLLLSYRSSRKLHGYKLRVTGDIDLPDEVDDTILSEWFRLAKELSSEVVLYVTLDEGFEKLAEMVRRFGVEVGIHGVSHVHYVDEKSRAFRELDKVHGVHFRFPYLNCNMNLLKFVSERFGTDSSIVSSRMFPFYIGTMREYPIMSPTDTYLRTMNVGCDRAAEIYLRAIRDGLRKDRTVTLLLHPNQYSLDVMKEMLLRRNRECNETEHLWRKVETDLGCMYLEGSQLVSTVISYEKCMVCSVCRKSVSNGFGLHYEYLSAEDFDRAVTLVHNQENG